MEGVEALLKFGLVRQAPLNLLTFFARLCLSFRSFPFASDFFVLCPKIRLQLGDGLRCIGNFLCGIFPVTKIRKTRLLRERACHLEDYGLAAIRNCELLEYLVK